jgi:hypothetical protein
MLPHILAYLYEKQHPLIFSNFFNNYNLALNLILNTLVVM